MTTIHVDGKLLFDQTGEDEARLILSPRLDLDLDGAGSLSFVMPPGHALYDAIARLKSIVTVEMDGETVFRGRAVDDERDTYNQKSVYCEGDRAFLLDSIARPYSYSGGVQAFFRQLVDAHNAQVDADKRFTVGRITAVDESLSMEAEDEDYTDTWARMEDRLLGAYGGHIRTRTEGGVTYLDWLTTEADGQDVEFGVNLIDLRDKLDASQVFTCLLPLGETAIGENGEAQPPVGIAEVNGGVDYIQDEEAVARYGRIWRTQTWAYERDPAKLLAKARAYLKTGICVQSLKLQFVDMHFTDSSRRRIGIGDHPRITSTPHGISLTPICVSASLNLTDPEKSTYTFGEAPRTLTENFVTVDEDLGGITGTGRRGGGGGSKKSTEAKMRWAIIEANESMAQINLLTHDQNALTGRVSNAEIRLDGIDATILLKADRELVNELETRVSSAEIAIDGATSSIDLKADSKTVEDLDTRVSSAEVKIDGLNSEITMKADKVTIDAELTTINKYFAGEATAARMAVTNLSAVSLTAGSLTIGNASVSLHSKEVVTSVGYSTSGQFNVMLYPSGASRAVNYVRSVSYDTEMIYYYSS